MSEYSVVILNTRPLTVAENQINIRMVDENEQASGVFKPTGASSSTVLLLVQPPSSKQQQDQRQDNPTGKRVKFDVLDLAKRLCMYQERALREREERVIDCNSFEEKQRNDRNSRSMVLPKETRKHVEGQDDNMDKGGIEGMEDVEMVTDRFTPRKKETSNQPTPKKPVPKLPVRNNELPAAYMSLEKRMNGGII